MSASNGFTLIELLISMVILAVIFSLGLFVSFDFYQSYAVISEKNTVVSLLQKARGQAQNNIDQVRHGVHFQANPSLQYILFECPAQNPACTFYTSNASDMIFNPSYNISLVAPTPALPFDIIFDQLSGDCINCQPTTIRLQSNNKHYDITINSEGQIGY